MKQFFIFLFFITFSVSAQDFSLVDSTVKTYPKILTAEKLADRIAQDFSSNSAKVRAVFSWLTQNIRYDLVEFYNPDPKKIQFQYSTEEEKQQKLKAAIHKIASETFSSRKAVCEGYARAFAEVCNLLDLENEVITGNVRNSIAEIGKIVQFENHAWNAVKLNGKWQYFDATWGAGYEDNGKWKRDINDYFFDIPKQKISLTHYAEDTLWRLRTKRISKKTFYNQPIYTAAFLKSNLKLISPTTGIIKRKTDGFIEFQLENIDKNQHVFLGFNGSNMAKIPKVILKENLATIKIIPPAEAKEAYLIIDNTVVLEFLIK